MKIIHLVEAWLYDTNGILQGGEEFQNSYAAYRYGPTTSFAFPDRKTLTEALEMLNLYGLESQYFYLFQLNPKEISSYPAIYFGIHVVDNIIVDHVINLEQHSEIEIVKDYQSDRIVISPRVKRILEKTSQRLQWDSVVATDGTEWTMMNIIETLPEPIVIPSPVEVGPNEFPPGTYWVRSDGRDVITNSNISKLGEVGLAVSYEAMVQSNVMRWRPRYVASGTVIHALQSASIKGLLEPVIPLIPESHPLSKGNV